MCADVLAMAEEGGLLGSGKPVSQWTNEELQKTLVASGSAVVPVTPSTRQFLEGRVEKLLLHCQDPAQKDSKETETRPDRDVRSPATEDGLRVDTTPGDGEFYGVVVQGEPGTRPSSLSPYYTSRSEAVRAVKSLPGARFKKFSTRASAEAFSSSPVDSSGGRRSTPARGGSPAIEPTRGDKPNLFPSLSTADLNRFRRLVEQGDVCGLSRDVWANPRYLVNCYGDAPEVLHVGFRYNALHCAVRAGRLEICKVLLYMYHFVSLLNRVF